MSILSVFTTACRWLAVVGLMALSAGNARAQAPGWQSVLPVAADAITGTTLNATGEVLVVGSFSGSASFGSTTLTSATGATDMFVAKWSPSASTFVWALRAGGNSVGEAVVVQGNAVYLAGSFSSPTADFGPVTLTNSNGSNGGADVFVARLTDTGPTASFIWAVKAGGSSFDQAMALAVSGNSIYLSGWFNSNTASFGTTTLTNAGNYDVFVAKLTDAGPTASFTWALRAGATAWDRAYAVAVAGNNVYVAGECSGPAVRFGSLSLATSGYLDAFVAKVTDSGPTAAFTWVKQAGGTANDVATALAVNGNIVYVAGNFESNTASFGNITLPNTASMRVLQEAFVAKLVDSGASATFGWALPAGGPELDEATALAVDGSNVYMVGTSEGLRAAFGSTVLPPPGSQGYAYVAKVSDGGPTASFTWAQRLAGMEGVMAHAVAVTGRQVYVVGRGNSAALPRGYGSFVAALLDVPAPVLTTVSPASGAVGSVVSLSGTNLAGTTAVTFVGTNANASTAAPSFVVNSAGTAISGVVVPLGASTGYVYATTPNGTSNRLPFAVASIPTTWQMAVEMLGGTATASATDGTDNVYIAGYFFRQLVAGSTILPGNGITEAFVAKWSVATSRFVWVVPGGGPGDDRATSLAVRGNQVYVGGSFASAMAAFGPQSLTNASTTGTTDGFVARLTDAGPTASVDWAMRAGGSGNDAINSLTVSSGSVYAAGFFSATAAFGTTTLASAGGTDVFIARLTDAGSSAAFVWAQRAGGTANDAATSTAANGSSVYVAGSFESATADFGTNNLVGAGNADAFVARLSDAGQTASFAWALAGAGPLNDRANAVVVAGTSVYVGGYFEQSATFGSVSLTATGINNSPDGFVAKVTDTGATASYTWALRTGGGDADYVNALAIQNGRLYVAGSFASLTANFGNTTLTNLSTFVGHELFVGQCFDTGSGGNFGWALSAGGISGERAFALALVGARVFVAGSLGFNPATFAPYTIGSGSGAFLATVTDAGLLASSFPAAEKEEEVLYPNPASTTVTILLPTQNAQAQVILFNALGQAMKSYTASGTALKVAVGMLPRGVYTVRIVTQIGSTTHRLVLE